MSPSSFEIKVAKRTGVPLLIQLAGQSGTGKTYTALQLAYGMVGGDSSKIIGIDTENRRMSLNADCLPGNAPFRVLEFYAPFSPARYIEAIDACCNAGAEVIVIDSISHEWESEGGCEWIAENGVDKFGNKLKLDDWKTAKKHHKRLMAHMLQCSAHVIACTRAREKVDMSNPSKPIKLGVLPIQEKGFIFETTISLMMEKGGKVQSPLKEIPAPLVPIVGRGTGYLTPADGKALREWADAGEIINPEVERTRGLLLNVAEQGMEALMAVGREVPKAIRDELGDAFIESVKANARAFDESRALPAAAPPAVPAPLTHRAEEVVEAPTPDPELQAPNPEPTSSGPDLGPSSLTLEPTSSRGPDPATEPGTAQRLPQGRTTVATDPQPSPSPTPAAPAAGRRSTSALVRRSSPTAAPAADAPIPGLD